MANKIDLALCPGECFTDLSPETLEMLRQFIMDEVHDSRYYCLCARCACTPYLNKQFTALANDECNHARKLESVYYIMTGEVYIPKMPTPVIPAYPEMLRIRFLNERAAAAEYCRAALATDDPCLKAILLELSNDELRHAQFLFEQLTLTLQPGC